MRARWWTELRKDSRVRSEVVFASELDVDDSAMAAIEGSFSLSLSHSVRIGGCRRPWLDKLTLSLLPLVNFF